MIKDGLLNLSSEVRDAIAAGKPVVALESTVIAHGLPRPQNLTTAQKVEASVRQEGAIPGTVAVLEGKLYAGLDTNQLEFLASNDDVRKLSTRDLPVAAARGWNGATTVASTMWIAQRAGVKVFATGGIGGVHRGAVPDISADLPELSATPMIVVCSGAKIVLDLPATREWLETNGVTVAGYGCDEMPAFYSRQSGLSVDVRCDSPEEICEVFRSQHDLGIAKALLVTVPVPAEFEVPSEHLNRILDESLADAEGAGIVGRNLTPFLLSRMAERSHGLTLRANIALLENNARTAARIAVQLARSR